MRKNPNHPTDQNFYQNNIDDALDSLDDLLDSAWTAPLSGGKCLIDADKVRDYLDDIRICLPEEIKQAKNMLNDKNRIIESARLEADDIIKRATERAKQLIETNEITRQAKQRGNEILLDAQTKAKDITGSASKYVDEVLGEAEDVLNKNLNQVKNTRNSFRQKNNR